MQARFGSVVAVDQAYCHGNRKGIAVLECNGTLQPFHIVGEGYMVVRGLHGLFHHSYSGCIFSAERNFGLVVEYQLITGAGASDCAYFAIDSFFGKLPLPVLRIRNQATVGQVDQALGNGKHGDGRVQFAEYLLEEPVYTERTNASDDKIGALCCFLPILNVIILYAFRERPVKLQMLAMGLAVVDDIFVKMSTYETYFVSILKCGECKGGSHHAGSDNGDYFCHN